MYRYIIDKFIFIQKGFIYILQDPSGISNKQYIGKTRVKLKRRLTNHISAARRYKQKQSKDTNYNYNWINSLLSRNMEPEIIAIEQFDNITLDILNVAEKMYIRQYKEMGIKLTNTSDGGDGGHGKGYIPTQEVKNKISQSLLLFFSENGAPNKGKHLTKEQKEHLSKINTGKKYSEEARKNMSIAHSGDKNHFRGKHHSEENKIEMSRKHAKITEEQVKEIKYLLIENKLTQKAIANIYNIGRNTILKIKQNKCFKYIKIYDNDGKELKTQDLPSRKVREPLSIDQVKKIKQLLLENKLNNGQIAVMFNTTGNNINNIKLEKVYRNIKI